MSRRRLAAPLLSVAAAFLFGGAACSPPEQGAVTPGGEEPSGETAPDFTLERLGGQPVEMAALRGKTVVIDFWATWCPPCEFQVPELNAVYEKHRESGDLEVLGISVDTDGPEVVASWAEEKGIEYPVLLGTEALARSFGALGFPTLVIVGPEGLIEERHVGLIERDELEKALSALRDAREGGPSPAS